MNQAAKDKGMSGYLNNTNAAKAPDDRRTSYLMLRLTRREKSSLVRQAQPGKLSAWVRQKLGLDP